MGTTRALILLCVTLCSLLAINAVDVSYDGRAIKIDGKRKILLSGSIHYPRSTPEMWPSLIKKAKEGGLDAIETYVFWNAHEPQHRQATVYSYGGKSVCFLGNANSSSDATINFQNTQYKVPAWSVSILPDCYTETYNTAKVNAQTSIMVMKDNEADVEDDSNTMNWQWMHEPFVQMKNGQVLGSVSLSVPQLLDQKVVTNDTSDYLWYITSVDIKEDDPIWSKDLKLRVNTNGHVLHVFVNGGHDGSHYALDGEYQFVYETKNYGAYFDNVHVGIDGPVQLVGRKDNTEIIKDITNNVWNYKVGLHGEHVKHFSVDSTNGWFTNGLPTDRVFVWYKTTFKSPIGNDPVVADLRGLGKGQAWVNGNNIGRYWPSYLADENGCNSTCDYRGAYTSNKCVTKCGRPSQRWYHVPRSFLCDDGLNTLVLFEELGGQPYGVRFSTVTIGKVCANAYEGHVLELACNDNKVISEIKFASFGVPEGECGSREIVNLLMLYLLLKRNVLASRVVLFMLLKKCLDQLDAKSHKIGLQSMQFVRHSEE
ncbi:Glycoside hydrolase, family 35 [Sesbania bispinosa]|nr:Glycoside hydrolase, family 35 [Sesbania bispinosa]